MLVLFDVDCWYNNTSTIVSKTKTAVLCNKIQQNTENVNLVEVLYDVEYYMSWTGNQWLSKVTEFW